MGVNQNISGLRRDGRSLATAPEVLTRRFLGWRTRYGERKKLDSIGQTEEHLPNFMTFIN